MKIMLKNICLARSGDKGSSSNVGIIFYSKDIYDWAKIELTSEKVKKYFGSIVKGKVKRYEMDNLLALNFILEDSLGGGGSESLLNDAQGKTHGQIILQMNIDIPNKFKNQIVN